MRTRSNCPVILEEWIFLHHTFYAFVDKFIFIFILWDVCLPFNNESFIWKYSECMWTSYGDLKTLLNWVKTSIIHFEHRVICASFRISLLVCHMVASHDENCFCIIYSKIFLDTAKLKIVWIKIITFFKRHISIILWLWSFSS